MKRLDRKKEFAKRLNLVLDAHNAPSINHGRIHWLRSMAERCLRQKITDEAVRKWLNGLSIPKTERLFSLAECLDTSVSYLLATEEQAQDAEQQPTRAINHLQQIHERAASYTYPRTVRGYQISESLTPQQHYEDLSDSEKNEAMQKIFRQLDTPDKIRLLYIASTFKAKIQK